ncbi:MAG TPA: hypothetical protein VJ032_06990 [Thermoanaerobaculia bacterium]|nr:hypothetical protein [Thermoanaerobaculia bacterium]
MPTANGSAARVQRLFGLTVRSNRPIPYTIELPAAAAVDVVVTAGALPPDFSESKFEPRDIRRDEAPYALATCGEQFLLTYDDGTRFVITRDAIALTWEPPLNFDDAATYLVGAAFALLLRLRGAACLHASAVIEGESVTAFVGPSGSGKSTAAAARVLAGATLVAEDVLPLMMRDGCVVAVPAYAGIRLWPEGAELLRGSRDAFDRISPTWDKRIVIPDRFATDSVPLNSLILLGDRSSPLTPADATMLLVANSYRPEMLDGEMRAREFAIFAELAASVPMKVVVAHSRTAEEARVHV